MSDLPRSERPDDFPKMNSEGGGGARGQSPPDQDKTIVPGGGQSPLAPPGEGQFPESGFTRLFGLQDSSPQPPLYGTETRTPDDPGPPLPPDEVNPDGIPDPSQRYLWDEEDLIGQGGVGCVYQAHDMLLDRLVAVKILREDHRNNEGVARRFRREGRITALLRHPGIPSIYDIGQSPTKMPFIAMQLVVGETLEEMLKKRSSNSENLAFFLTIFLKVVQAIAHAHQQGIVHRDLKPGNIMVGEFGIVVVLDWGFARLLGEDESTPPESGGCTGDKSERLTRAGMVFGTPVYLPPEQALGRIDLVDRRADVFGLGAILHEILIGHPPYSNSIEKAVTDRAKAVALNANLTPELDATLSALLTAELGQAIQKLSECECSNELIRMVETCLKVNPDERYKSAGEMAEVLTNYFLSEQRQAERRLSKFFDLTLDILCIADMNGHFKKVAGNFMDILGYTEEELTAKSFMEFVHDADKVKTEREIQRLAEGEKTILFENRYKRKDGKYAWLEWNAQAVPDEQLTYAVARDVTGRHEKAEAERKAEEQRQHLAAAVHSADESVVQLNLDGYIVDWNPGAERLFGHTRGEMIGRRFDHLIPRDHVQAEEELFRRVRDGGEDETREAIRHRKDGTPVKVSVRATAVRNAAGDVTGVVKVARDISDQQHLEDMIAGLPDGFITINETGGIVSVNPSAAALFGYAPGELLGKDVRCLIPQEFHAAHDNGLKQYLTTGEAKVIGKTVPLTGLKKNGTQFPLGLSLSVMWVKGQRRFAGVIRDNSAQQAEALLAAECQKATGYLSAATKLMVAQGVDLTETLRRFPTLAIEHLGVACSRVWTVEEQSQTLVLQASAGLDSHPTQGHARIPFGACEIGRVAQERTPQHADDVDGSHWRRDEGLPGFAGHPLMVGDRLLGVNAVFSHQPLSKNAAEAIEVASHTLALRLHSNPTPKLNA